ncbi:MAG: type II toxin-antitoxin system RelE/ParE family toxin [Gammaproteobacteria bacterium]
MNLIIHPEASVDIQEEADYYENIQPGLGLAFLDEVDAAIETVLSMPQAFPERRKDIRIFIFARFPFSLLYRANETELQVLVVRHHARREEYGMERV